jgi:hypothetical protein
MVMEYIDEVMGDITRGFGRGTKWMAKVYLRWLMGGSM